jgi:hypothetical protein
MAHFAEIDSKGIVLRVLVVDDSQEHRGQEFLAEDLQLGGTWVQTSYNSKIRGKYAAVGDKYDKKKDEFIAPIIPLKIEDKIINDQTDLANEALPI